NPVDYLTKIMPATTIRAADGTYVSNVLPFPTPIIQSVHMAEGKAVVGLPKRYFACLGTAKSGKLEYSDEYHFL
ncbi:phage major capsid protein, partial [Bittarella massiliensis]|nr:phage major capsid protein [Bittarella massiliensis (ex Durand et al. 2017)]